MSVPALKRINDIISDELYPGQILKVLVSPTTQNPLLGESESDVRSSVKGTKSSSFASRSLRHESDVSSMQKDFFVDPNDMIKYKTMTNVQINE